MGVTRTSGKKFVGASWLVDDKLALCCKGVDCAIVVFSNNKGRRRGKHCLLLRDSKYKLFPYFQR
jgi:hypothetical protein